MRGLIGLVVVIGVIVVAASFFMGGTPLEDQHRYLAVAFGVTKEDTIQIHIGVAPLVPRNDPPERDGKPIPWEQWVGEHYQVRGSDGVSVPVIKVGTSALLQDRAAGIPEFAVSATVKKGKDYSLDFVPVFDEGRRYRWSFTAPTEPKKAAQERLDFVVPEGETGGG